MMPSSAIAIASSSENQFFPCAFLSQWIGVRTATRTSAGPLWGASRASRLSPSPAHSSIRPPDGWVDGWTDDLICPVLSWTAWLRAWRCGLAGSGNSIPPPPRVPLMLLLLLLLFSGVACTPYCFLGRASHACFDFYGCHTANTLRSTRALFIFSIYLSICIVLYCAGRV